MEWTSFIILLIFLTAYSTFLMSRAVLLYSRVVILLFRTRFVPAEFDVRARAARRMLLFVVAIGLAVGLAITGTLTYGISAFSVFLGVFEGNA